MTVCEHCGNPLPPQTRGRPKRFCSRDCQVAAWRQSPAVRSRAYDRHSQPGTCIRFDPDIHDRLQIEADTRGLSVNWIVNRLVREGLDRIIPADQFTLVRPGRPTS